MISNTTERRPVDALLKIKLVFLGAAFVSFLFSVYLFFFERESQGIFVGLWVPSILGLGALLLAGDRRDR